MTLDQLPPGQEAHITAMQLTGRLRQRLMELGFIPGTAITALHISPLGDPIAYRILDTVIALRKCDAAHITIEER